MGGEMTVDAASQAAEHAASAASQAAEHAVSAATDAKAAIQNRISRSSVSGDPQA